MKINVYIFNFQDKQRSSRDLIAFSETNVSDKCNSGNYFNADQNASLFTEVTCKGEYFWVC